MKLPVSLPDPKSYLLWYVEIAISRLPEEFFWVIVKVSSPPPNSIVEFERTFDAKVLSLLLVKLIFISSLPDPVSIELFSRPPVP